MNAPRFISGADVRRTVSFSAAADAIETALGSGLDPEADVDRSALPIGDGELLIMPALYNRFATVKLVTVGGSPRIQGIAIVFETSTLSPVAAIDGMALTVLRTAAVSLVAARRMVGKRAAKLVLFGRGPQARAHSLAMQREFDVDEVTTLHSESSPEIADAAISDADLICCATTSGVPLFDGDLVSDSAAVIAVGSHHPHMRELDADLVGKASIVVESRRSAVREAGDLVMANADRREMITLAELVAGRPLPNDRPRLFKSTGMSWEDAVVASLVVEEAL